LGLGSNAHLLDQSRIVLGGSTVFQGSPLGKSIPGQIETELLRRGFSGAKVYNFGLVAAVSGQELALVTHICLSITPPTS
jgi:hypothetical protein